jgi:transcriptional regulator with XRE-family HTH domain
MNIKYHRNQKSMTQEELGALLQVTGSAVSQWEKEKRHPSILMMKRIAAALGCTVDELLKDNP